jgi:hypothetical protein
MSDASSAHPGAVKLLGMEIPLPSWAVTPVAILAVIGAAVFLWLNIGSNETLRRAQADLQKARNDLQTAQDSLRSARDDYDEYVRHTSEAGNEFHREPNLTVKYYESDGCLYVLRASSGQWLRDATKRGPAGRSPGDVSAALSGGLAAAMLVPVLYRPAEEQGPGGGCLNPHPGKYQSSDGQRKGCWLQVWRRWPDGCAHYQWFNTCASTWELDSRGRPAVHWTACRH